MASGNEVGNIYYVLDLDDSKFKGKASGASKEIDGLTGSFKEAEKGSQIFAAGLAAVGVASVALGVKSVAAYTQSEDALAGLSAGLKNTYKEINTAGYWTTVHTGATKANEKAINNQIESLRLQRREITLSGKGHEDQTHAIDLQILALQKSKLATDQGGDSTKVWVAGTHKAAQETKGMVEELQKQATALQQVSKFSDEEVLSADAMLTTFQLQKESIMKINPVMLDMAEGLRDVNGQTIGLGDAAKLIGKVMGNAEGGIDGLSTALRRQGIIMTDAQKKIFETGTELERVNTLTEIITFNFGGRALAAAQTFSGMWTILGNNVNDVMEIIGKGIVDSLRPMLVEFDKWFKSVGGAQGVIDLLNKSLEKLVPYFPIILGFILGGLTPAFTALAVATWAAFAPLIPFMVIGALLGVLVLLLVDAFGGWDNVMKNLKAAWDNFMTLYNSLIKPAIDYLWQIILNQLVPALKQLWGILSPILIPVLQFLGKVLIGIVIAAIYDVIMILIIFIHWLTELITSISETITEGIKFFNELKKQVSAAIKILMENVMYFFNRLPGDIENALRNIKNLIVKPFEDAWNALKGLLDKIGNAINNALNPTQRHSPSLVDKITSGVDEIVGQYSRLSDMTLPNMGMKFIGAASPANGGGVNQDINIQIGSVGGQQDVSALGRELGYRAGLLPR